MRPSSLFLFLASIVSSSAASIHYSSVAQSANVTTHDWVFGSKMWGGIESGTNTATSFEGFSSLTGLTPSLLKWTFGDLELTSYSEPTSTTSGFEVYSEGDSSLVPLNFYYDNVLWATGTLFDITANVVNNSDATAAGTATGQITAAGANAAFYNEIMTLTGGSGLLSFSVGDFNPVNNDGLFTSGGVLTFVTPPATPDGGSTVALFAFSLAALVGIKRVRARP